MSVPAGYSFDKQAWGRLTVEDRDLHREALAGLTRAREQNPLAFYVPHPKQKLFHESRAAHKLFFGGNRSGKTHAGIADDLIQAVDGDCLPDDLRGFKRWEPPFYCRIVIPDMTRALEGVTLQKFRELCPRSQLAGGSFQKAYEKNLGILRFENGSWVQFLSNEMDVDKFSGAALHRTHFDEEPREEVYKESLVRLIDYGGDCLFTMTPLLGMSWTFERFWEPWEKAREHGHELQDTLLVTVDMDDNPHLDDLTKKRVLSGYSADERKARKEGRFVHFGGLIYPMFTADAFVPDLKPEEVSEMNVVVGIDPGFRHMAAVVYCAFDADGVCHVFDEIAEFETTAADVAKQIHLKNSYWDIRPDWYVLDPSGRNKQHETGRSVQMEFQDHGVYAIPAQNSVTAGINRVKEWLEADRVRVGVNCRQFIRQMRKQRWATRRRGENAAPDKPVKDDDDLPDAFRYVLMSRPHIPEHEAQPDTRSFAEKAVEHQMSNFNRRKPAGEFGPGIYA